jgi:hypothetical protein
MHGTELVKSNPTSIDKTMHACIDDRDQADGTDYSRGPERFVSRHRRRGTSKLPGQARRLRAGVDPAGARSAGRPAAARGKPRQARSRCLVPAPASDRPAPVRLTPSDISLAGRCRLHPDRLR